MLGPGHCAGFEAGDPDGHCLQNRSIMEAIVLKIGTRVPTDTALFRSGHVCAGRRQASDVYPQRRHTLYGHQTAGEDLSFPRVQAFCGSRGGTPAAISGS
jgi:uncharacterized cupin superfamily protein